MNGELNLTILFFFFFKVVGTNYRTSKPAMIFNPKGSIDTMIHLVDSKEGHTLDIELESLKISKFGTSKRIRFLYSFSFIDSAL